MLWPISWTTVAFPLNGAETLQLLPDEHALSLAFGKTIMAVFAKGQSVKMLFGSVQLSHTSW